MCSLVVLFTHVMRTRFKYALMRMLFIRVPGERTVQQKAPS